MGILDERYHSGSLRPTSKVARQRKAVNLTENLRAPSRDPTAHWLQARLLSRRWNLGPSPSRASFCDPITPEGEEAEQEELMGDGVDQAPGSLRTRLSWGKGDTQFQETLHQVTLSRGAEPVEVTVL